MAKNSVPKRSYGGELQSNLTAQENIAPQLFGDLTEYGSGYSELLSGLYSEALGKQLQMAQGMSPTLTNLQTTTQQDYIQQNPVLQNLYNQAFKASQSNGEMSDTERMALNEEVNSSLAPGMQNSNRAMLTRILSRGQYTESRKNQNMNTASSLYNLVNNASSGITQGVMSLINPSMAYQTGASGLGIAGQYFNPESSYGGNVAQSNQQADAQNANNKAGFWSGLLKGVANVGLGLAAGGTSLTPSGAVSGAGIGTNNWMTTPYQTPGFSWYK